MNPAPPHLIRVAPATVIIFGLIFSPALFLGGLLITRGQQIPEALGLIVFYLGFVYWICSPSIELGEDRLVYRALFKRNEVQISNVERIAMHANPAPTLTLTRKDGGSPLSFIVKPFSKSGIVAMIRHIREWSPEVQLDGISQDMSQGNFDSISKETLSTRNLIRIALGIGSFALGAAVVRAILR